VRHFGHADFDRWRGGRWNHTCFGGRCGWWWLAGGSWYFYNRPVYPYPVMVGDITYAAPEPVVVAPAAPPPLPVKAAPRYWYYCDAPAGYYPYVANCSTQYRAVPIPEGASATPAASQSPAEPQ
jgi:hypothetical protein